MKRLKDFLKEVGMPVLALGLPLFAVAQSNPDITPPPPPITTPSQLILLLCTIINWLFWLLIVLTIIFVLLAAFKYLTASGAPEKVKSASNTLLYAAIAVVVALLAKGVPLIIASFIGASLTSTGC